MLRNDARVGMPAGLFAAESLLQLLSRYQDDKSRRNGPARAASLIRALLYFRRLVET